MQKTPVVIIKNSQNLLESELFLHFFTKLDLLTLKISDILIANLFFFSETLKHLWRTERFKIFKKGLTARMTSSIIYSIAIIFGYETVKKWSVHEEYKPMVKW